MLQKRTDASNRKGLSDAENDRKLAQQNQERGSEEEKTKNEDSSTNKVPTNEAQWTSLTSRSATTPTEETATKMKIINTLDRLTTRRQEAKVDALIDYLIGDIAEQYPPAPCTLQSPLGCGDRKPNPTQDNRPRLL